MKGESDTKIKEGRGKKLVKASGCDCVKVNMRQRRSLLCCGRRPGMRLGGERQGR